MAGAMRKMAVYLGLVEDEDRYDDEYADDTYDELGDDYTEQHTVEPDAYARGRERERGGTVATLADRRPVAVATTQRMDSCPHRHAAPADLQRGPHTRASTSATARR